MTIDETLRATLHVMATMQIDILLVIQEGTLDMSRATRILESLASIQKEVAEIRSEASLAPQDWQRYAVSGQTANMPSDN